MSYGWPILSTVTFLPLVGALLIFALRGDDESAARNARYIALWTTLITFAISLLLWIDFDSTTPKFQFVEERAWLGPIRFHIGIHVSLHLGRKLGVLQRCFCKFNALRYVSIER